MFRQQAPEQPVVLLLHVPSWTTMLVNCSSGNCCAIQAWIPQRAAVFNLNLVVLMPAFRCVISSLNKQTCKTELSHLKQNHVNNYNQQGWNLFRLTAATLANKVLRWAAGCCLSCRVGSGIGCALSGCLTDYCRSELETLV